MSTKVKFDVFVRDCSKRLKQILGPFTATPGTYKAIENLKENDGSLEMAPIIESYAGYSKEFLGYEIAVEAAAANVALDVTEMELETLLGLRLKLSCVVEFCHECDGLFGKQKLEVNSDYLDRLVLVSCIRGEADYVSTAVDTVLSAKDDQTNAVKELKRLRSLC